MNCFLNIPLCLYEVYLNPVYQFVNISIPPPIIYVSYLLKPVFLFLHFLIFFPSLFFLLMSAYPQHSSCSYRHPVSQKQSQRRLYCAMCLCPLLQDLQKWAAIMPRHLQAGSQKKGTKRMSLVTAGVSCLFVMHFIVRGIKIVYVSEGWCPGWIRVFQLWL